jgi:hypothetical protein
MLNVESPVLQTPGPFAVNTIVSPRHMFNEREPVITGAVGNALTVTEIGAEVAVQPFVSVTV